MTPKNSQKNMEKLIDKMDVEIMDWFYEVIKINFGVAMVQDSTELREILKENLLVQHKEHIEILKVLAMLKLGNIQAEKILWDHLTNLIKKYEKYI